MGFRGSLEYFVERREDAGIEIDGVWVTVYLVIIGVRRLLRAIVD